MWIEKYTGLLSLYELIFDDGNMGETHLEVMKLYLRMADGYPQILKEDPEHNRNVYLEAIFDCLDHALAHAKKYDTLPDTYTYTAPLADHITVCNHPHKSVVPNLSTSWIFNRGLIQILEKDSRWEKWLETARKG